MTATTTTHAHKKHSTTTHTHTHTRREIALRRRKNWLQFERDICVRLSSSSSPFLNVVERKYPCSTENSCSMSAQDMRQTHYTKPSDSKRTNERTAIYLCHRENVKCLRLWLRMVRSSSSTVTSVELHLEFTTLHRFPMMPFHWTSERLWEWDALWFAMMIFSQFSSFRFFHSTQEKYVQEPVS